ncbi:hypothetical protein SERLA73DRAFT_190482 [Serpula lacrymans var. lacrymans S7.3]|uniref:Uncharacterized protein n=2 Tax=Serpula lacrymans var. lacrymans TaxID=341189 RepID=F8QFP7_SERL3|nr:uncharacterized protein SERLADRAFT_457869 [Serpula lacrymans var. lacrymans S7.9]EGN92881.1 hypothetical protein SERLA73DRAFT_190482 [Serpula lacrymans var. lacrymans S7.3]EGO29711.1 hypothetical protein SERLADRAFT_457869 [Serpula lacrymans var. lacrymans S7.9]
MFFQLFYLHQGFLPHIYRYTSPVPASLQISNQGTIQIFTLLEIRHQGDWYRTVATWTPRICHYCTTADILLDTINILLVKSLILVCTMLRVRRSRSILLGAHITAILHFNSSPLNFVRGRRRKLAALKGHTVHLS